MQLASFRNLSGAVFVPACFLRDIIGELVLQGAEHMEPWGGVVPPGTEVNEGGPSEEPSLVCSESVYEQGSDDDFVPESDEEEEEEEDDDDDGDFLPEGETKTQAKTQAPAGKKNRRQHWQSPGKAKTVGTSQLFSAIWKDGQRGDKNVQGMVCNLLKSVIVTSFGGSL